MTQRARTKRCEWCGAEFAVGGRTGRPPKYCRRSHRQRHYEARRLGSGRGLSADEVLLALSDYERLRDAIYVLEAAIEDVAIDLRGAPTKAEYAAAVMHLRMSAAEAVEASPVPSAIGD